MKILIPVDVYQKLKGYAQATNFEISGLGKIFVGEKETITIEEIKIFEQEVTYANTKLDRKALARFYDGLMKRNEDPSVWKLWWHSHGKMDTFWSATDIDTINDFDMETGADNWMFSLETNHEEEIITRIDIFKPLRVTIQDIPWEMQFDNKKIENDAFNETMLKIRTPVFSGFGKKKKFPLSFKKENLKKLEIIDKTGKNTHLTLSEEVEKHFYKGPEDTLKTSVGN